MRSRRDWTPHLPTPLTSAKRSARTVIAHYLWPGLLSAVVNRLAGSALMPMIGRRCLLRAYGITIGHRCRIMPGVYLSGRNLAIGDHTFINQGSLIDTSARVTIGSRVAIGPRVMLVTASHVVGHMEQRAGAMKKAPVSIEDGAWIGAGAVVLPGVRIGAGAVVAAGAVVIHDCMSDMLYAGVPAREVRDLDDAHASAGLAYRRGLS